MADITIDTTAPAYQTRHTQFQDIVSFWRPRLIQYFTALNSEQRQAMRDNDPFLNDILRFCEAVERARQDEI